MVKQTAIVVLSRPAPKELESTHDLTVCDFTGWATIPADGVATHVAPLIQELQDFLKTSKDAIVNISGEPRACYQEVTALPKGKCFSTFSTRVSKDVPQVSVPSIQEVEYESEVIHSDLTKEVRKFLLEIMKDKVLQYLIVHEVQHYF